MVSTTPTPLAGGIVIDLEKVRGILARREQRLVRNEVRETPQDRFGMREIQNLLKVGMGLRMAGVAKCRQVLGRIVALVKRNTFAASVDVVNVKPFGRAAFPAGVTVAFNDRGLVGSKEMPVLGNLAPFSALDVRLVHRVRAVQFVAILAGFAAALRAGLQNVGSAARNARLRLANNAPSFRASTGCEAQAVLFKPEGRFALDADLLRRARWLVGRFASQAFALKETATRVAAGRVLVALFCHVSSIQQKRDVAKLNQRLPDATLQARSVVGASY